MRETYKEKLLEGVIKPEQMPDLIRYCYENKIEGQFRCYNPHWLVSINEDIIRFAFSSGDDEDVSYQYDEYDNPEDLINENHFDGDDWWFRRDDY
jgi:hypothetical protein